MVDIKVDIVSYLGNELAADEYITRKRFTAKEKKKNGCTKICFTRIAVLS